MLKNNANYPKYACGHILDSARRNNLDMFGPVKVAVQSSASTVKLESSDSQPMARSSSLNVSLSSAHQPAPTITKRKRGHNMMSGIGKKAWVSS